MAGEITEFAQIAPYGGPNITITGSSIGNAAKSILAYQGTGSARGIKMWKSGQADFLNTLKTLTTGALYIVNAKTVPMDFPPPTSSGGGGGATPSSADYSITADVGDASPTVFAALPCPQACSFAVNGSVPSGVTLLAALNGGTPGTLSALNDAVKALTSFPYTVQFQLTRTDTTVSTTVTLTLTTL